MEHSTTSVQALLACSSNRDVLFVQTELLKRFDDQFSLLNDAAKLAEEQKDESKARFSRARLPPMRSRLAPAGQGAACAGRGAGAGAGEAAVAHRRAAAAEELVRSARRVREGTAARLPHAPLVRRYQYAAQPTDFQVSHACAAPPPAAVAAVVDTVDTRAAFGAKTAAGEARAERHAGRLARIQARAREAAAGV